MKYLGKALLVVGCSQTLACTDLRDPTDGEFAIFEKAVTALQDAAPIERSLADQAEGGRDDMGKIIDASNELLASALAERRFVVFDVAGPEHEGMGGWVNATAGEGGKPLVAIHADLVTNDVSTLTDTLRHESIHGLSEDFGHSLEVQDAVAALVESNAAWVENPEDEAVYNKFLAAVQELSTTAIEMGDASYMSGAISSLATFPRYYNERILGEMGNAIKSGDSEKARTEYASVFSSPEIWAEAANEGYADWSNDYPGMDQIILDVTTDLKLKSDERQAAFSFDTTFYEQGKAEGEALLKEADEASGETRRERRR